MDLGKLKLSQKTLEDLENEIEKTEKIWTDVESTKKDSSDRLLYQLNILKQAIAAEEKRKPKIMKSMIQMMKLYFTLAIDKAYPQLLEDVPVNVTLATRAKFGDYQFNSAPLIFKKLKGPNGPTSPRQVAERIIENFPQNNEVIEKLEVAGAGFVNVHLNKTFLEDELLNIFKNGVNMKLVSCKRRVVVDFSAPNVAKEMHVGHLRSTIIGESICRLLEYLGYDVLRINHIGDWGTQFGMLIAHLQDTFPDYLKSGKYLPISDLQAFYKESKHRFDSDEEFKKRAYNCVVQLQSHHPDFLKAWNLICDVSRKEFSKIYERLGVTIKERGESFYQSRMENIVKDFQEKGYLEDDAPEGDRALQGTMKIYRTNVPNVNAPLILVKSDGGFTYDTSDVATIKQRIEEEKADRIIYVTDEGQSVHFKMIWDCAKRVGIWDPLQTRLDHVGFGVVLGEDKKKFKTRSGDTVKLSALLDEGLKRAEEKLKEKGREKELNSQEFEAAKRSVAYGCIKYADLSHNRNHEYVFSFDKMLEDKGNTAVYLLYAYSRIKSIARKAKVSKEDLNSYVEKYGLSLNHEKEVQLGKKLITYPEVVEKMVEDLQLHPLCELLYDIAVCFSEFYDNCYCIERDEAGKVKNINMDRLVLCEATAAVLKKGFDILGLEPVEKM